MLRAFRFVRLVLILVTLVRFNFSEYIHSMLAHTTVFRLVSAVWHVCSSYPHNSPVLRHLDAQTAGVDHTVRGPGFSIKSYFPLAGCDPEGSQTKLSQKQK